MLLAKYKISGHSMLPFLKHGDVILASSIPYLFSNPKIGDVVVFRNKKQTLIKRISKIKNEEIYLMGDNKADSLDVGNINKRDIIGKYIIKI